MTNQPQCSSLDCSVVERVLEGRLGQEDDVQGACTRRQEQRKRGRRWEWFPRQRLRLRVLQIIKVGEWFSPFRKSVAGISPSGFCLPWVSASPSSKSVARTPGSTTSVHVWFTLLGLPLPRRHQNRRRHRRHICRRQRLWRTIVIIIIVVAIAVIISVP